MRRGEIAALDVAPFAGAWIEIGLIEQLEYEGFTSLPSRERGLKYPI